MRTEKINSGVEMWNVVQFDSLIEFYKYLEETPVNKSFQFRAHDLSSKRPGLWSGTNSYEEAIDLFKNGWSAGAKDLTKNLKLAETNEEAQTIYKNILSMAGYQAIVPLYLNGVPNNMLSKKQILVKNKVITINKVISASSGVSSEKLMNESIKCFQIIKKIESSGIRVNLNLMMGTGHACVKIRLKSAGERLNISKLAFPLVHTAMFRRLYFRFVEIYPTIPKNFVWSYGRVPSEKEFKNVCRKDEVVLPTLLTWEGKSEEIKTLSVDQLIERLSVK